MSWRHTTTTTITTTTATTGNQNKHLVWLLPYRGSVHLGVFLNHCHGNLQKTTASFSHALFAIIYPASKAVIETFSPVLDALHSSFNQAFSPKGNGHDALDSEACRLWDTTFHRHQSTPETSVNPDQTPYIETWFRSTRQYSLSDALLYSNPEKDRCNPYQMHSDGVMSLQTI